MGAYNDLLKKYGVEVPPEESEAHGTGLSRPDRSDSEGDGSFAGISTEIINKPNREETTHAGSTTSGSTSFSRSVEFAHDRTDELTRKDKNKIPGVFSGGASSSSTSTTRLIVKPYKPRASDNTSGKPTESVAGVFHSTSSSVTPHHSRLSDWLRGLPPYWWVDLVLILISVLGAVLVFKNLPYILYTLANWVLSSLHVLCWIILAVGILAYVILALRRGRRRWRR